MCGRAYSTYTEEELEARYLTKKRQKRPLEGLLPNYNVSPTQTLPVILIRDHGMELDFFRWGLIPAWAKDIKSATKYNLINAKGEEIEQKKSYREAFITQRCIVPVSGFFEWKRSALGPKKPFAIHLIDEPIMSLAAVWESWNPKEGERLNSFSIVTTAANTFVSNIHDRMPVILKKEDEKTWLDLDQHDLKTLKNLLGAYPSENMSAYEVSTLVNSPRNNTKENLRPIKN